MTFPFLSRDGAALAPDRKQTAALDFGSYLELTKPRLSALSVVTALVGYLAAQPQGGLWVLGGLLVGTSLAAGAAGALNQYLERELDQRMARTRGRPVPSGVLPAEHALIFGLALAVAGLAVLALTTNLLATAITAAILLSYLGAYTPLKTRSPWCTVVGAIPGALPPLVGWAAATGTVSVLGWILFGLVFAWQIPHFFALAWTYRADYREAGMPMLTVVEPSGARAARQSLLFTLTLVALSLLPVAMGLTSAWFYGTVSLAAGGWFLLRAWQFAACLPSRDRAARKLFFASISYLPLLLAALVLDRWLF